MRIKLILVMFICLMLIACWVKPKMIQSGSDKSDRYFQYLKVNNDLTFSGANELTLETLEGKEYFHFVYEKNVLTNIISHSSISNSFYELNKYIFNVNEEWKEITIKATDISREYTFTNNEELIKFVISYQNNLPTSFKVLPFKINYDNFNVLGKSVIYSGKVKYNDKGSLDKIIWLDSKAEYFYIYDKKNILTAKNIYNNGSILYEYRFKLNDYDIVESVK